MFSFHQLPLPLCLNRDLGMLTINFSAINRDFTETDTAASVLAAVFVGQRSRIRLPMQP